MTRHEPLDGAAERELDALDRVLAGERVDDDLLELALLVSDVRATAPTMTPAFAARLERDVADGFAKSTDAAPARGRLRSLASAAGLSRASSGTRTRRPLRDRLRASLPAGRRWLLAPAAGLAVTAVFAFVVIGAVTKPAAIETHAQSAPGAVASADQQAPPAAAKVAPLLAQRSAAPTIAAVPAPLASRGSGSAIGTAGQPRKLERNALLVLSTTNANLSTIADEVIQTSDRFGGIVRSSNIGSGDGQAGEADFDLRIPTAKVDAALAAFSRLAHVAQRSQNSQDITGSFVSIDDRLSDARAERRGLQRALGLATTQIQIDALRARLRASTSRVARLKGDLAALARRADFSTVSVTVRGGAKKAAGHSGGGSWTPLDAARDALRVLEVAAGVILIGLAVALPILVLGALAVVAARVTRRRRREGALDAA